MANVKEYVQSVVNAIGAVNPNAGVSAINPTGTYNKISLNTSLSVDEVNNILSKLTYFGTSPQKYYVYCQDDKNYICIVKLAENVFSINGSYFIPNGNTVGNTGTLYSKVLFMSISLGEDAPAGFYVDNISEFEKHFNFTNGLSSLDGNPVGQQNDLLKNLIYVSSNTINAQDVPNKIRELKVQVGSKQLLGTYDGSSIEVTEAGVVDIGAMLDEGKLPLEVNVNIEAPVIEGTIDITENGTYDVSQYAKANVNVASGGGEDMLQAMVDATNSCENLFYKWKGTNADFISKLDTSKVTNMNSMFANSTITSIPLLNTSNVTTMGSMFSGCSSLISIPLLDTSKVTAMNSMFNYCYKLTTIPQLNTSNVTNMNSMFSSCSSLISVPALDTSNVTDMSSMFNYCSKLEVIEQLDMISVINNSNMFRNNTNITRFKLLNIKTNLSISVYSKTEVDSLIGLVKELINTGYSRTLTMGTNGMNNIANIYVKFTDSTQTSIATNTKGDVVVCESTDEGAMLLSDYATLKNWTLA